MEIIAACLFITFCFAMVFIINKNSVLNKSTYNKIFEFCKERGLHVVSCKHGGPLDHLLHGGHTSVSVYRLVVIDKTDNESKCLCVMKSYIFHSQDDIHLVWNE